jgi:transcriptional regulator with XRE-family HTH domain
MPGSPFRERLRQELDRRRGNNRRYSLRAFAAMLSADHSSLSQVLRGTRRVPAARIAAWGERLGLGGEEILALVAAEALPDEVTLERQRQLQQRTAESGILAAEGLHWRLCRLVGEAEFRPDCRWIAARFAVGVDEVHLVLSRLLRLGLLEMSAADRWRVPTSLADLDERAFREVALARIRAAL